MFIKILILSLFIFKNAFANRIDCFKANEVKFRCEKYQFDNKSEANYDFEIEVSKNQTNSFFYSYGKALPGNFCFNHHKKAVKIFKSTNRACVESEMHVTEGNKLFAKWIRVTTDKGFLNYY